MDVIKESFCGTLMIEDLSAGVRDCLIIIFVVLFDFL